MTEEKLWEVSREIIFNIPSLDGNESWNKKNEVAYATGLEDACVGVSVQKWGYPFVVYDYLKSINVLVERDKMSEEEAEEFLNLNTWDLWTDGVWGCVSSFEMFPDGTVDDMDEILGFYNDDAVFFLEYQECLYGILSRKCFPSRCLYDARKCFSLKASVTGLDIANATDMVLRQFFTEDDPNNPTLIWTLPNC